jgi:hypothetical protein
MNQLKVMSPSQIIQRFQLKEIGTILIKLKNKSHQFLIDVYYIPSVKKQYIEFETIVGEGL